MQVVVVQVVVVQVVVVHCLVLTLRVLTGRRMAKIAFVEPWIRNNGIVSWRTFGFRLISEILFQRRNDTPNTITRPTLFLKGSHNYCHAVSRVE